MENLKKKNSNESEENNDDADVLYSTNSGTSEPAAGVYVDQQGRPYNDYSRQPQSQAYQPPADQAPSYQPPAYLPPACTRRAMCPDVVHNALLPLVMIM